jgi:predicted nucleic acid-binding protein
MLLLDTNLVSELMRPGPDPRVLDWVAAQPVANFALAAITVMEVRFGITVLPHGRSRAKLDRRFDQFLAQGFADRILAFNSAAAGACAELRAIRRQMGRPIALEDGMIAATAKARGATVVTRDTAGFDGCGLALINPWED